MRHTLICLFSALILASCGDGNGDALSKDVKLDSINVDSTYALNGGKGAPCCEISLHLKYIPGEEGRVFNNELLRSGILMPDYFSLSDEKIDMRHAVDSFVSRYVNDYKNEYGEMFRNDPNASPEFYNCTYKVSTDIVEGMDSVLTYKANTYYYGGGPHGTSQTLIRNFSRSTLKLLSVKDFFVPGYEQTLKDLIQAKLQDKYDVSSLEELRSRSIFMGTNVYVPDNFIPTKDGFTFIYCAYEIAPYSEGEIRVEISSDELEKILK